MSKKTTPKSQKEKFIQAAKEHGCDVSEKEFEDKLKKISQAKTKSENKKD